MTTTTYPKGTALSEEVFVEDYLAKASSTNQEIPDELLRSIYQSMVVVSLYVYNESKQKIGTWKIPDGNTTTEESLNAHRAYRIAKAVSKLIKVCVEKADYLRSKGIELEGEGDIHQANAKLDKLISFLEKYWGVDYMDMWVSGKIKPVAANTSDVK